MRIKHYIPSRCDCHVRHITGILVRLSFLLTLFVLILLPQHSYSQNQWDGDNGVGNFDYNNNWFGDIVPVSWNGYTDLIFAYNNASQTSLWQNIGWRDVQHIIFANTFNGSIQLDGNGSGLNFGWKIENYSSYPQIINIPLNAIGAIIELNPITNDLTINNTISNGYNLNYNIYGTNSHVLFLNGNVQGSNSVSLNIIDYSKVAIGFTNPPGSFGGGVNINTGELWFQSGSAINGGIINVGSASKTAKLYISAASGGTTVNNNIVVVASSTSTVGGLNSSGINTFSGSITLNNSVTLETWSDGTIDFTGVISGNYPVTISRVSGSNSATVKYSSTSKTYTGITTIANGATLVINTPSAIPASNDVSLQSGGGLKVSANQTVRNLIVPTGSILTVDANQTLTITGTWTGGGTIINNGTIVLAGPATFPGIGTTITAMNNLTVNRAGGVTLDNALTVSGVLTLTNGIVTTTATNILSVTNTAINAITGYSSSSYIKGPLQWTLLPNIASDDKTYFFPVGDGTPAYRPFELVNIRTGATSPVIRITVASAGASTFDATIASIAPRNWRAEVISGNFTSTTVRITESGLTGTCLIGTSAAQGGAYTMQGNNAIGTTITSIPGITIPTSPFAKYFAIGSFPAVYYNKPGLALNLTTSWGSNTDGSGTSPTNFTSNNQVFNIYNGGAATLTAAWIVSGTGSEIVVGDGTIAMNFTIPAGVGFSLTTTPPVVIDVSNNATLTIRNTIIPSFGVLSTGSTVDFNSTSAQTIPAVTYYNLTCSGSSGNKTFGGACNIQGTFSLSGANTVYLNPTTTQRTFTINNVNISAGTLDNCNASFTPFTLGTIVNITSSYTQTAGTNTTSGGNAYAEILFTGGGNTTYSNVYSTPVTNWQWVLVKVSDNTTLTLLTDLMLWGQGGWPSGSHTMTVDDGSTLIAGTKLIKTDLTTPIWTFNGTVRTANTSGFSGSTLTTCASTATITPTVVLGTSSIVDYNGVSPQIVTGRSDYANIIINNTAGATTSGATTLSGTLSFFNGILTTTSGMLAITNNSNGAVVAPSVTKYVNGPMQWTLASGTSYTFPVGKGGTYYPFSIKPTGTAPVIQVEAFSANCGGTATPAFTSLSTSEYWSASKIGGTYTTGIVGLTRQAALGTLNAIGRSGTANGIYANLNGAINGLSIINSDPTGASLGFFAFGVNANPVSTITTGTISGAPFCAGATAVNVSFTYAPPAGFPTATFTAQLSNRSGSFVSPVTLQSVASNGTGSQSISVTIPAGTTSGNGYRIRVVSNNPAIMGTDNGSDFTVITRPTPVVVTPASQNICPGAIQRIIATGGLNVGEFPFGSATDTTVGNSFTATLGPNPMQNFYGGSKQQMIFTASELIAAGIPPGPFTSLKVNLLYGNNGYPLLNFTVKMGHTAINSYPTASSWVTGLTTVRNSAPYTPQTGLCTVIFNTPFVWNGTSNIIVEMSYSNNNIGTNNNTNVASYTHTPAISTLFFKALNTPFATIDAYVGSASYWYSARTDMVLVDSLPNTITWSPITNLYTNALATTSYVAGTDRDTLYAKPGITSTYTASSVSYAGCVSSGSSTITVNPLPTATITPSGSTTICAGSNVILTASVNAGYLWSTGATTQSITASTAGIYTVTVTDGIGCTAVSAGTTVAVNTCASITLQPDITGACHGDTIHVPVIVTADRVGSIDLYFEFDHNVLTYISPGFANVHPDYQNLTIYNYNYNFSPTIAYVGILSNDYLTSYDFLNEVVLDLIFIYNVGTTNIHLRTVADGYPDCAIYDIDMNVVTPVTYSDNQVSGSPNPLPVAVITPPGSTSFCTGGSVNLTASGGAAGYQWSNASTSATINVTSAGTYTVTVTDVNGCHDTESVSVIANDVTPGSVGSNQTICNGGDPAAFTQTGAATGTGMLTYQWQSSTTNCGAGYADIAGATATTYDPPAGLTQTTYYQRVAISTLNGVGCVANSNCITVTVIPCATVTLEPVIGPLCIGSTLTVHVRVIGTDVQLMFLYLEFDPAVFTSNGNGPDLPNFITNVAAGPGSAFVDIQGINGYYATFNGETIVDLYFIYNGGTSDIHFSVFPTPSVVIDGSGNPISTTFIGTSNITGFSNPVAVITPGGPTTFCQGGSVNLVASGGGAGGSYLWSNAAATATINVTAGGPYTVTVTDANGCIDTESVTVTVTPNNTVTLTSAVGTNNQTKCINTAITNITYATTGATGATVTGLPAGVAGSWASNVVTISGTPTASGTFNYTVTLTGGCGNITATGTITVIANNTVTLTSAVGTDNQTKCINTAITNITYATTGATGATVTGLPAGVTGAWASNVVTISGTPTASGTFNYTVTLTGGCGNITTTGTITVTANNTVTLTSAVGTNSQTLCINTAITNITYATTGATGATVTGLPAGVTGTWASNVVTINGTPTASGTFNYTVTLTGGCGNITASGTITVTANNTVTLTSAVGTDNQTKCINTAITNITYGTTGATGATVSGLPAGVTGSWASNVVTISGTPTASGTFNYTVTLNGGCGNITATGTITVTANNTVTLTSAVGTNSQTLCVNTAITNITYSTTGATGATFSGLPPGVSGNWAANVVTISGTPTGPGAFTYIVTLTGGCGNVIAIGTITVTTNNAVTLTSAVGTNNQAVCINTPITNITYATTGATGASVTGLPAGVTGSWALNIVTISGTPMASGTFNYTVTLTGGCGLITATGTITVNPLPTITLGANPSVCQGANFANLTYSATAGTPNQYSIDWNGAAEAQGFLDVTNVLAGSPIVLLVPGGAAPATYNATLTVTNTTTGCTSTTYPISVTVNPIPTITLGSNPSVCLGITTANLTYSATTGTPNMYSIIWNLPAPANGFGNVTNAALPASPIVLAIPPSPVAATYSATLTVTNSSTGCVSSGSVIFVTILPSPACAISGAATLCPSATGNIYSGPAGMTTYAWSISGNGTIPGATNGQTVTVTAGANCNSTFTLSLTVTDASGCSSTCTDVVTVQDITSPVVSSCPGNVVALAGLGLGYASISPATPLFSDNCTATGSLTVSYVLTGATTGSGSGYVPSPTQFNIGTTTVTYTITDACGNSATCAFDVIVTPNYPPDITCLPAISQNADPGLCTALIDPGFPPNVISGTPVITFTWIMTGATTGFGTGAIGPFVFNIGVTTITWRATNFAGFDECTQTVTVTDNQPPTFTAPGPSSFCVNNVISAVYNPAPTPGITPEYDDITTARPEYYQFTLGSNIFDLDPNVNNFNDNCCADNQLVIHWRIDFSPTPDPSTALHPPVTKPAIPAQTGQPSIYGNIEFPGDGVNFINIDHHLYYWLVDCNGNASAEQMVTITIKPRPNVIKQ